MPDVRLTALFVGIEHWGRMLGKIRTELFADAEWDVNVEGEPLAWIEHEQRFDRRRIASPVAEASQS